MKQLTVFEMEAISGGYSWDMSSIGGILTFLVSNSAVLATSATLGASVGGIYGSIIGGRWGGAGGGILGFGAIGQAVGMVWGLVVGAIGCGVAASVVGWDKTYELAMGAIAGSIDGTLTPWN